MHLFFIFSLLCSQYVTDLIKKLELRVMVASVLLKIKFRHAQINVPNIGAPMSKTACFNPGHWAKDEIWVALQNWLWVRVELMAWQLSRLERLDGIQWSWVQIPLKPTISQSKNRSAVNTIHITSYHIYLFIHDTWLDTIFIYVTFMNVVQIRSNYL